MASGFGTKSAANNKDFLDYNETIERARSSDFSRLQGITYLDHAGTTLYSERLLASVFDEFRTNVYGNPHSGGASSQLTAHLVEVTRCRVLKYFNTSPDEYNLIFTSGCTDSLKLLAHSFKFDKNMSTDPAPQGSPGSFCYLQDNHTSVLGIRAVAASRNVPVHCLQSPDDVFAAVMTEDQFTPGSNLFAFPAQSNFSGRKYPLEWVRRVRYSETGRRSNWFVILDAAVLVATSMLDLSTTRPDFVSISFYKMFGFPTGLGALLVRNTSAHMLRKTYFGGGTIQVALPSEPFHVNRTNISQRFEDGTIPFLDIIALRHGFESLQAIAASIQEISRHTFTLAQYVHHKLANMRHDNGVAMVTLYCDDDFDDVTTQGPIVTFNLRHDDNSYIGYAQVETMAQLWHIQLRTGCFCNLGACQRHLGLSDETIRDNFESGHVCGDSNDLVKGQPTGCVRISFGYCCTLNDADTFLRFVENIFNTTTANNVYANHQDDVETKDKNLDEIDKKFYLETSAEINDSGEVRNGNLHEIDEVVKIDAADCSSDIHAEQTSHCVLHRLFVYPIKSCGAFEVARWPIAEKGLLYDREWMILDETGKTVGQKRVPQMCRIRPIIDREKGVLMMTYPGMKTIDVPLENAFNSGEETLVTQSAVCADRVDTIDCGQEVSKWLSDALATPGVSLVRQTADHTRQNRKTTDCERNGQLSFVNEAQYLLVNLTSIQILQRHLEMRNEIIDLKNLTERFRANLVIDGGGPFVETDWTKLKIGHHSFVNLGSCRRCQVICVDQSTGIRSKEPFTSLASLREKSTKFGILLQHDGYRYHSNELCIGDVVTATKQETNAEVQSTS